MVADDEIPNPWAADAGFFTELSIGNESEKIIFDFLGFVL